MEDSETFSTAHAGSLARRCRRNRHQTCARAHARDTGAGAHTHKHHTGQETRLRAETRTAVAAESRRTSIKQRCFGASSPGSCLVRDQKEETRWRAREMYLTCETTQQDAGEDRPNQPGNLSKIERVCRAH
eukprot:6185695-Pleurochrysis_carterae.AAC.2